MNRSLTAKKPSPAENLKNEYSSEFSEIEDPTYSDEQQSTQSKTPKKLKGATRKSGSKRETLHECDCCNYRNWRKCAVSKHMAQHHQIQLTCDICSFKARSLKLLKYHIKSHVGQEGTGELSSLPIKEEKEFIKKEVRVKQEPADDMAGPPNYSDDDEEEEAEKEENTSSSKKTRATVFKCEYCSYSSRQKCHVMRHTRERHFRNRRPGGFQGRFFTCYTCDYSTFRKRLMETHIMRHTGEKPYRCKICNYKCILKVNLKRHQLTHTGETPFACTMCEYRCKQSHDLTKHMRTHTGDKPYACDLCDYRCAQVNVLKAHKKKCHRGKGINTGKLYTCDLCSFTSKVIKKFYSHLTTSHAIVLSTQNSKDTKESDSEVTQHQTVHDLGNGEFIKIEIEDLKQEEEEGIKQEGFEIKREEIEEQEDIVA